MDLLTHHQKIVQICYVVVDLTEACRRFNALLGIGPFVGSEEVVTIGNHLYRGKPAPPMCLSGAFVQSGDVAIELVQIHGEGPSAYHDSFPDGGEGIHHVAVICDDYAMRRDELIAQGYAIASEFEGVGGKKVCYVDTRETLGHMLELCTDRPELRAWYRQTREAAERWDGRELLIPRS